MALWQYTFHILPYGGAEKIFPDLIFNDNIESLDTDVFWKLCPFKKDVFSDLNQVLQKTSSWSTEIDLYGKTESTCCEILFDLVSNDIVSASFRIDFTTEYKLVLKSIINLCILENFIILDKNNANVVLNYDYVNNIIINSPQMKKYKFLSSRQ